MARHLEMKPSKVTNALFRFVTQPVWFEGWTDYVADKSTAFIKVKRYI
jgi:hypothetical protein